MTNRKSFSEFLCDQAGKRIFYRADFNVPMRDGKIADDTRVRRSLPGIMALHEAGCKIVLASHLGRPVHGSGEFTDLASAGGPGTDDPALGLRPVSDLIARLTGLRVRFCPFTERTTWQETIQGQGRDDLILLDNLRFFHGEEKNAAPVSIFLASLADAYVNDAFACCHRSHASIVGITEHLPTSPGPLIEEEVAALTRAFDRPASPAMAIVGGAKVSTKIQLLSSLAKQVDVLLIGGGMANTLLAARGISVGSSLYEPDCLDISRRFLRDAGDKVCLPEDAIVAPSLNKPEYAHVSGLDDIGPNQAILDIGPKTCEAWLKRIDSVATVVWNGPVGVFEIPAFAAGSLAMARRVAKRSQDKVLDSIAGGGDTLSLLRHAGVMEQFGYVSTAGGAFLEYIEGQRLPGLVALGIGVDA